MGLPFSPETPMETTTITIMAALALLLAVAGCSTSQNTSTAARLCQEAVPIFEADRPGYSISEITDFQSMQIEIKNDDINPDHPLWYLSQVPQIFDFQSLPLEINDDELICHAQTNREVNRAFGDSAISQLIDKFLAGEGPAFYCLSLPIDERKGTLTSFTPDRCLEALRENAAN